MGTTKDVDGSAASLCYLRDRAEHCPHCGCSGLAPVDTKPDEPEVACNGCELYFDPRLLVGYKLTRDGSNGWCFLGTTPREVSEAMCNEIESDEGLTPDEIGDMTVTPFTITKYEIETMPEFPGW